MLDILLGRDGDISVSTTGDISLTNSVRQAILVRLRWIYNEWRLGPEYGFPWFEEVFVKNPNTVKIRHLVRDVIMEVDNVQSAEVSEVDYDPKKREAKISYRCAIGGEIFNEVVILNG